MFRAIQIRLQLLVLGSSTSVLVCSTESGALCIDNGGENSMAQYLLVTTISHDRHTRIVLNIARGPGSGLGLHIDMLCYVCSEKGIPCNKPRGNILQLCHRSARIPSVINTHCLLHPRPLAEAAFFVYHFPWSIALFFFPPGLVESASPEAPFKFDPFHWPS